MATTTVALADLSLEPADDADIDRLVRDLYAFLGPDAEIAVGEGTVTITLPDPSSYQRADAERAFQSAMKAGERHGGGATATAPYLRRRMVSARTNRRDE